MHNKSVNDISSRIPTTFTHHLRTEHVVTEVGLAYKTALKMLFQFLLLMNKYLQYTDIPQNTVELFV